jgi:hexosaminidase
MKLRFAALALALAASPAIGETVLPLVPLPAHVQQLVQGFRVANGTAIAASGKGSVIAAQLLRERVEADRGLTLSESPRGAIRIERDKTIVGAEAYRLTVDSSGIRIAASTNSGLIYGAMTLAQLLSPDDRFGQAVVVPGLRIDDSPRFRWRGYMADVARHFQPIESLKRIVDQMVELKLNMLHLHLTDDQGWRVEIKRYPELTRIGAWRTEPTAGGGAPARRYGGYYTQAQLRDLVAYASSRGITIVPEVDLPGHAQAIVASYPQFGVFGDRPPVSGDWGINPYLLDPGPKGIAFVENVLDEIMTIFPGPYIHLGGDEAIKDQWERSPRVQALMKGKGIKSEDAVQSYLIHVFDAYLRAHGRRLIGWDEILQGGGLPPSAIVMSWQGEKGAVEASKEGHDVVLSPAPTMYLDNLQSWLPDEPPGRAADPAITLETVYDYDPMPKDIAPADRGHVLGAQMNAWSEYLVTPERVQWATFPRLAALAEGVWSPAPSRDFGSFLDRLEPQVARWRREGITAADSAFAVAYTLDGAPSDAAKSGTARVKLSNQTAHGTIRYTLDGSAPTAASPIYADPLTVRTGTIVRASTFGSGGILLASPLAFDTSLPALLATGTNGLSACSGQIQLRFGLTPDAPGFAPAYDSNFFDSCFVWHKAPLSAARGFRIDIARLPRNLALAHDFANAKARYPATAFGEFIVSASGCNGKPVATFPLPDPATAPTQFSVSDDLPETVPDGDLCMTFTAPTSGPLYVVGDVQLKPK